MLPFCFRQAQKARLEQLCRFWISVLMESSTRPTKRRWLESWRLGQAKPNCVLLPICWFKYTELRVKCQLKVRELLLFSEFDTL